MGSSLSEMTGAKKTSNLKEHNNKNNNNNSTLSDNPNTMPSTSNQQKINTKTPQEKCTDISNELNSLEKEVVNFTGTRNDKTYLKLEELLTRCLLKLDEIDRGDEKINDLRKHLINYTHKLSDKLEKQACDSNEKNCSNQSEEHKESDNL